MKLILVGVAAILFCISGCKKSDTPVDPTGKGFFDLSLGKTWMYAWSIVETDSTWHALATFSTDSFQVRIASTDDTLGDYRQLIRFEAQSIPHFIGATKVWYQFAGDSLVEIAYNNAGATPVVLPKREAGVSVSRGNEPALFSLFPRVVIALLRSKGFSDSTLFRDEARIVYKFPLTNGKTWVSFTNPFLQVREVVRSDTIIICAGRNFLCAKIKTTIPEIDPTLEWYDYVSTDGLIERRINVTTLVTDANGVLTGARSWMSETLTLISN